MTSNQKITKTEPTAEQAFSTLSDDARLWIFQSERRLSPQESEIIKSKLDHFLSQWKSHNNELLAEGEVFFNHFVVIAVDEKYSSQASGCSIDSMTHEIQSIARSLDVDLLNRSSFYFQLNDEIIGIPMAEIPAAIQLGKIKKDSLVFDNLIKTKKDLRGHWLVPMEDSWHKRFC